MNTLYINDNNTFLCYNKYNNITQHQAPCVIFHHGLMSDMNGKKAIWIENHCKLQNYNFIRFDNFGHGKSSGRFTHQTISDFQQGLEYIIDHLSEQKRILLVGSSMGAWITMLTAIKRPDNIIGMVGVSSALDFSEELIWNKLTNIEKHHIKTTGMLKFAGIDPNCNDVYPISFDFIQNGRKHLLLNNNDVINIKCPVHLLHGQQDYDVPSSISERIYAKIIHTDVSLKLIKDGNHTLSRKQDLQMICNSIDEIINRI